MASQYEYDMARKAQYAGNSYISEGQSGQSNPANQTYGQGSKASAIASGIGYATQLAGAGYEYSQDLKSVKDFDVDEALPQQNYNPYFQPPTYIEQEVPYEISEGTGARSMLKYGTKGVSMGAQIGTKIGGPIGGLVGAGIGLTAGVTAGAIQGAAAKNKRMEFEAEQKRRYDDFMSANQRYYDVLGTQTRARAQAQSIAKRGQNVTPYYDATIYGFM